MSTPPLGVFLAPSLTMPNFAGQERFRSVTKTYFRRADGVMLLYDVTSERSFSSVRSWVENIDVSIQLAVR